MTIKLDGEIVEHINKVVKMGYFDSQNEAVNSLVAFMAASEINNSEEVHNIKRLIMDGFINEDVKLVRKNFKDLLELLNIDLSNLST